MREGDRVLVIVVGFEGKHKIKDKWEDNPHIIISQLNLQIPVYKVQREDVQGRTKILHRNLLLPIGSKLMAPIPAPRARLQKKTGIGNVPESESVDIPCQTEDSDGSESVDYIGTYPIPEEHALSEDETHSTPTISGDDQNGVEYLDEGSGEDAHNQIPELVISDDPDSSSIVDDLSSSVSRSHVEEQETETASITDNDDDDDDDDDDGNRNTDQNHLRRSNRTRKKPGWMDNYVLQQSIAIRDKAQPGWMQNEDCFNKIATQL